MPGERVIFRGAARAHRLTAAQLEAVMAPDPSICVLATAGAGKTRVLTLRIARRVSDGTADRRRVLVCTFSRKAASELRARLWRIGVADVCAGTLHRTALGLLAEHASLHGYPLLRRTWTKPWRSAADRSQRSKRSPRATGTTRPNAGGDNSQTLTTFSWTADTSSHQIPASPRPSAGDTLTCSWTSSRTSIPPSSGSCAECSTNDPTCSSWETPTRRSMDGTAPIRRCSTSFPNGSLGHE